jgi:hypothetical protein
MVVVPTPSMCAASVVEPSARACEPISPPRAASSAGKRLRGSGDVARVIGVISG